MGKDIIAPLIPVNGQGIPGRKNSGEAQVDSASGDVEGNRDENVDNFIGSDPLRVTPLGVTRLWVRRGGSGRGRGFL